MKRLTLTKARDIKVAGVPDIQIPALYLESYTIREDLIWDKATGTVTGVNPAGSHVQFVLLGRGNHRDSGSFEGQEALDLIAAMEASNDPKQVLLDKIRNIRHPTEDFVRDQITGEPVINPETGEPTPIIRKPFDGMVEN